MKEPNMLHPVTERPFNAETPIHALRSEPTPTDSFYVRNHFDVPLENADRYKIRITGAVAFPKEYSLNDLKEFPEKNLSIVMECAGNGRSSMNPKIIGTPWDLGAISQAEFSGTSLFHILKEATLADDIREIKFSGADRGILHTGETENYIRSLPVEVAQHPDTMLVWKMNGQELTPHHGYPLRLIVPGWYGMASVKWLNEITALTQPFDGFFQAQEYVYVGEEGIPDQTPVTKMRIRSIITHPETGMIIGNGSINLSGVAWSGEGTVEKVDLSFDQGENWVETSLEPSLTSYDVARWEYDWHPTGRGRYLIISKATDTSGRTQPLNPIWNKGGYGNNTVHQIEVRVE